MESKLMLEMELVGPAWVLISLINPDVTKNFNSFRLSSLYLFSNTSCLLVFEFDDSISISI